MPFAGDSPFASSNVLTEVLIVVAYLLVFMWALIALPSTNIIDPPRIQV